LADGAVATTLGAVDDGGGNGDDDDDDNGNEGFEVWRGLTLLVSTTGLASTSGGGAEALGIAGGGDERAMTVTCFSGTGAAATAGAGNGVTEDE
jgi:hypothetical protein